MINLIYLCHSNLFELHKRFKRQGSGKFIVIKNPI